MNWLLLLSHLHTVLKVLYHNTLQMNNLLWLVCKKENGKVVKCDMCYEKLQDGKQYLEEQEPKIKWGEFKKAGQIDDDGIFRYGKESVPGVVVTTRPDKFTIK